MKNENAEGKINDKKITITFIVNGEAVPITVNLNAPLKSAVEKVLTESENTGRPFSDWQVKLNGQVLDLGNKIEDLHLPENAELLLSLKTGEGGSNG